MKHFNRKNLQQELKVLALCATTLTLAYGLGWATSHLRLETWGGLKSGGITLLRQVDHANGCSIKTVAYSSWAGGQRATVWMGW